jgi:hypothetical protein
MKYISTRAGNYHAFDAHRIPEFVNRRDVSAWIEWIRSHADLVVNQAGSLHRGNPNSKELADIKTAMHQMTGELNDLGTMLWEAPREVLQSHPKVVRSADLLTTDDVIERQRELVSLPDRSFVAFGDELADAVESLWFGGWRGLEHSGRAGPLAMEYDVGVAIIVADILNTLSLDPAVGPYPFDIDHQRLREMLVTSSIYSLDQPLRDRSPRPEDADEYLEVSVLERFADEYDEDAEGLVRDNPCPAVDRFIFDFMRNELVARDWVSLFADEVQRIEEVMERWEHHAHGYIQTALGKGHDLAYRYREALI